MNIAISLSDDNLTKSCGVVRYYWGALGKW